MVTQCVPIPIPYRKLGLSVVVCVLFFKYIYIYIFFFHSPLHKLGVLITNADTGCACTCMRGGARGRLKTFIYIRLIASLSTTSEEDALSEGSMRLMMKTVGVA